MSKLYALPLLLISGTPCAAQDLGGALDLGQLGRDMSYSATMKAQGNRAVKARRMDAQARETMANCRKLRGFKRPTGPKRADYDKALSMCRTLGY